MPSFSEKSVKNLKECHLDLIELFNHVITSYDCTIIDGHRSKKDQDLAYHLGKSKLQYPNSKHNKYPSLAVDVAPYPIDWNDRERFYHFAGYVKAVADNLGINIRWGGCWNGDNNFKDNKFDDLVHWELIL